MTGPIGKTIWRSRTGALDDPPATGDGGRRGRVSDAFEGWDPGAGSGRDRRVDVTRR